MSQIVVSSTFSQERRLCSRGLKTEVAPIILRPLPGASLSLGGARVQRMPSNVHSKLKNGT